MKLYELFENDDFESDSPLRIATTATLAQIKSEITDTAYKGKFTVNALRKKLRDNGVNVTHEQLIELIKEEPWKNLISNIKGDQVIFKGEPEDTSVSSDDEEYDEEYDDSDESEYTMKRMADRAAKKSKEM